MPNPAADFLDDDEGTLVVEQRFAIVPEWIIDADVSDCAYRLYSVLLRYGQTSGTRMPSRATLAARLHKSPVDTVDRAMRELLALMAVSVRPHYCGSVRLTNQYLLHHRPPAGGTATRQRRGDPVSPALGPSLVAGPTVIPCESQEAAFLRLGWPHPCGPTQSS